MNYMKQIAQMLEVELDEEFKVIGNNGDALLIIKEDGIYRLFKSKWVKTNYFLDSLLTGKIEITKKPILDDKEKEYLSSVIKPFRNNVISITKLDSEDINEYEYVCIEIKEVCVDRYYINLPYFKKGTMYKGMEVDKEYSVGDLEL